ncbi:MAG: phosphatidate cytidylyltransferase [Acidobacteriaceae bacterium]|nr:phosphatidate cytidylyltransferase [Acidobacteriaceae bacterium]MBV9782012.1 phosphatidate cytidylyltransferase [Acidobacteriaceae bacterium]
MKRPLTAVGLIAVATYLVFFAPQWLFLVAAVCMSLLCFWEYAGLVGAHNIPRPGLFGIAAGILILLWPEEAVIGLTILSAAALTNALRDRDLRNVLPAVSAAFFGALYTFAPWRFAVLLRSESVHWLFFGLALNWAGDTLAYYTGRRLGKHRLAATISPNKSWEGAVASVFGSVAFGLIYMGYFMPQIPFWHVGGIALAGNIAGQCGDLAESAVKRGAGIKDSGAILPGHGGMLDRVDSSLFSLPVVYVLSVISGYLLR